MAFTIADAMFGKKYGETSFGERLQSHPAGGFLLRDPGRFSTRSRRRRSGQSDDSEARRQWKRFQMISTLPERDRKAVVRLIHSLAGAGAAHRNGAQGELNGR